MATPTTLSERYDILKPPKATWIEAFLATLAGGIITAGIVAIWIGVLAAVPIIVATVLLARRIIRTGRERVRCQLIVDQIVTGIYRLQGLPRPDRTTIAASVWDGDLPRLVAVEYLPTTGWDEAGWATKICEAIASRWNAEVKVAHWDRLAHVIAFNVRPAKEPEPEVEPTRMEALIDAHLADHLGRERLDLSGREAYRVQLPTAPRYAQAGYRLRVERAIEAQAEGRWRCLWDLSGDSVRIEERPALPRQILHPVEIITDANRFLIPVGEDEDREVVRWNLKGTGPHMLVTGKTGTGKTVAVRGTVCEFSRRGWPIWIADPKRIEFLGFRDWPNVQIVATDVEQIMAVISCAHKLMEERYAAIEAGADERTFEPLLLVVDEYRNLLRLITAWYDNHRVRGMQRNCPVLEYLPALAEKARSAKIYLEFGTQRPDAAILAEGMRDNIDTRVATGRLSPQGAMMVWQSPGAGATVPRDIPGRGMATDSTGEVREIQVYWTPDPLRATRDQNAHDLHLLDQLRPAVINHPPLKISFPPRCIDPDEIDTAIGADMARILDATLIELDPHDIATPAPTAPDAAPTSDDAPTQESETDEDTETVAPIDHLVDETPVAVTDLAIGDLILIDEDHDEWATVDELPMPDEDNTLTIGWRNDNDDLGTITVDEDDTILVRHQLQPAT